MRAAERERLLRQRAQRAQGALRELMAREAEIAAAQARARVRNDACRALSTQSGMFLGRRDNKFIIQITRSLAGALGGTAGAAEGERFSRELAAREAEPSAAKARAYAAAHEAHYHKVKDLLFCEGVMLITQRCSHLNRRTGS